MKVYVYIRPKDGEKDVGCITIENAIRTAVAADGSFHAENSMGSRWAIPRSTIHMIETVE